MAKNNETQATKTTKTIGSSKPENNPAPPVTAMVPVEATPPPETKELAVLPEDFFALADDNTQPGEDKGPQVAYVGFRSPKAKSKVEELDAAGVQANRFYLYDGEILNINPFEIHVLKSDRFWTKVDQSNRIVAVKTEWAENLFDLNFREQIVALVLVPLPGDKGLIPAVLTVRSGLCAALKKSAEALKNASNVETWSARSPGHAASAVAKQPPGRFRATIWATNQETTKVNKHTGEEETFEFNKGESSIRPTSPAGVKLFNDFITDQWQAKVIPAYKAWMSRCEYLRKRATAVKQIG